MKKLIYFIIFFFISFNSIAQVSHLNGPWRVQSELTDLGRPVGPGEFVYDVSNETMYYLPTGGTALQSLDDISDKVSLGTADLGNWDFAGDRINRVADDLYINGSVTYHYLTLINRLNPGFSQEIHIDSNYLALRSGTTGFIGPYWKSITLKKDEIRIKNLTNAEIDATGDQSMITAGWANQEHYKIYDSINKNNSYHYGYWWFESETTAPPTIWSLRLNNSDKTLATELYISVENTDQANMPEVLQEIDSTSLFLIRESNDPENWALYVVTGNTDNTTYFTFDITYLGGHAEYAIADGDKLFVDFDLALDPGIDLKNWAFGNDTIYKDGVPLIYHNGTGFHIVGLEDAASNTIPNKQVLYNTTNDQIIVSDMHIINPKTIGMSADSTAAANGSKLRSVLSTGKYIWWLKNLYDIDSATLTGWWILAPDVHDARIQATGNLIANDILIDGDSLRSADFINELTSGSYTNLNEKIDTTGLSNRIDQNAQNITDNYGILASAINANSGDIGKLQDSIPIHRSDIDDNSDTLTAHLSRMEAIEADVATKADAATTLAGYNIIDGVKQVNNVDSIRSIASSDDIISQLITSGYYSPGDGGGAEYYWDASSTATDNGGSVIKVTAITTGRYLMKQSNIVNPLQWGCDGDSTTNDDTELNAMINDLKPYNVIDLQGITYLSDHFKIQDVEGVTVKNGTIKADAGSSSYYLAEFVGIDNLRIDNLTVHGDSATIAGITVTDCQNYSINNCLVKDIGNVGMSAAYGINSRASQGFVIDNSRVFNVNSNDVSVGINIADYTGTINIESMDGKIVNNYIEDITPASNGDGIKIQALDTLARIVVSGNTFKNCAKRFIKTQASDVVISDNVGLTDGNDGFGQMYAAISAFGSRTRVTGNVLRAVNGADMEIGITIGTGGNADSSFLVHGNVIESSVQGASNGYKAIEFEDISRNVNISDNTFVNFKYGIFSNDNTYPLYNVVVKSNSFYGLANQAVYFNGTEVHNFKVLNNTGETSVTNNFTGFTNTSSDQIDIIGNIHKHSWGTNNNAASYRGIFQNVYDNYSNGSLTDGWKNGKRYEPGTAAPSSGNYTTGDYVFNTDLSTGVTGWICTSGNDADAGTWKAVNNPVLSDITAADTTRYGEFSQWSTIDSDTARWTAKQDALGYTPADEATTLTINGTSYDLSMDRSWTVSGTSSGSGAFKLYTGTTGGTAAANRDSLNADFAVADMVVVNSMGQLSIDTLTIPSGKSLYIAQGSYFDVSDSALLLGGLDAGRYQIFTIASAPYINADTCQFDKSYPEWFGAVSSYDQTYKTVNRQAIQAVSDVFGTNNFVYFEGDRYYIDTTITMPARIKWKMKPRPKGSDSQDKKWGILSPSDDMNEPLCYFYKGSYYIHDFSAYIPNWSERGASSADTYSSFALVGEFDENTINPIYHREPSYFDGIALNTTMLGTASDGPGTRYNGIKWDVSEEATTGYSSADYFSYFYRVNMVGADTGIYFSGDSKDLGHVNSEFVHGYNTDKCLHSIVIDEMSRGNYFDGVNIQMDWRTPNQTWQSTTQIDIKSFRNQIYVHFDDESCPTPSYNSDSLIIFRQVPTPSGGTGNVYNGDNYIVCADVMRSYTTFQNQSGGSPGFDIAHKRSNRVGHSPLFTDTSKDGYQVLTPVSVDGTDIGLYTDNSYVAINEPDGTDGLRVSRTSSNAAMTIEKVNSISSSFFMKAMVVRNNRGSNSSSGGMGSYIPFANYSSSSEHYIGWLGFAQDRSSNTDGKFIVKTYNSGNSKTALTIDKDQVVTTTGDLEMYNGELRSYDNTVAGTGTVEIASADFNRVIGSAGAFDALNVGDGFYTDINGGTYRRITSFSRGNGADNDTLWVDRDYDLTEDGSTISWGYCLPAFNVIDKKTKVYGPFATSVQIATSSANISAPVVVCTSDAAGDFTLTLPAFADSYGEHYTIINRSNHTVTIAVPTGEVMDETTNGTLTVLDNENVVMINTTTSLVGWANDGVRSK